MAPLDLVGALPTRRPRRLAAKRLIDIAVAGGCLMILAPVLLLLYLGVRTTMGRPAVYRQLRPGRHGRLFAICKFRTMTDVRDDQGHLLPDGERLTPFGRFLRTSSLDELPELWNVLRGDMSLVGPRPLLVAYTDFFTSEELCRQLVRPGITGWAQIHGRNDASWDERLGRDLWYLRNWSFTLDLKILVLTAVRVLTARGVVVDAESVMLNLDDERRIRRTAEGDRPGSG